MRSKSNSDRRILSRRQSRDDDEIQTACYMSVSLRDTAVAILFKPSADDPIRAMSTTIDQPTNTGLSPQHCIYDGILGADELLWIYSELLSTSSWTLTRTSTGAKPAVLPFIGFPGLEIETDGKIHIHFLSGYFRSVVFRIRTLASKNGITLPPNIRRIHVGAKSSFSKTEFHVDSDDKNAWTILGFLNPVWNAKDGGEFFLEHQKIEYKSGRFVLFPSNISHDGGYVKNEKLNYWRVAANIILDQGESKKSSPDHAID